MMEDFAVMLQGIKSDCAVLRLDQRVIVVDTGWEEDFSQLDDFLEEKQVEEIDLLLLSHFDLDHIGGAAKLLASYPVKTLVCPNYRPKSKDKQEFLKKLRKLWQQFPMDVYMMGFHKMELQRGGALLSVYPSPLVQDDDVDDENEYSLIASVEYQGKKLLFMGDAETNLSKFYLENHLSPHDFMKIPHHASYKADSFTNLQLGELLNQVNPRLAIATCRAENEEIVLSALEKMKTETKFTTNLHENVDIWGEI